MTRMEVKVLKVGRWAAGPRGEQSRAEPDTVVLTLDLEVRVPLALPGAAWRLTTTRRPCRLLRAELPGVLWPDQSTETCSPHGSVLASRLPSGFGIPGSSWVLREAIPGRLLTSRPRRECWNPWPVDLAPSFPGAEPQGRWWEVPYLGCPEHWNEVRLPRAGPEGPYLV